MTRETLHQYRILERIGGGGMGEIYRAVDRLSGSRVAIKVPLQRLQSDPVCRSRFRREARALSALEHPNICAIRGAGRCEGIDYLVMELLEGRTLREHLADGPMSLSSLLPVALPMARALAAAHARGVLHGDLKPENVFITRQGVVKLLDFGLSRLLSRAAARPIPSGGAGSGSPLSRVETLSADSFLPGRVYGTLSYMSPEQVRGEPIDARSDLFSVGVVLYEMVSGRRPFAGKTWADTLALILRDDPPSPCRFAGWLVPGFDDLVRRCLEKERDRRVRSAERVVRDLEQLQGPAGV